MIDLIHQWRSFQIGLDKFVNSSTHFGAQLTNNIVDNLLSVSVREIANAANSRHNLQHKGNHQDIAETEFARRGGDRAFLRNHC